MDIKLNEYVRTKDGHIAKYIEKLVKDEDVADAMLFDSYIYEKNKHIRYIFLKEIIVKHSKQLIGLIEKDDYVNGYKVIDILKNKINNNKLIVFGNMDYEFETEKELIGMSGIKLLGDKEIRTILTKESYMANCYKTEREETN